MKANRYFEFLTFFERNCQLVSNRRMRPKCLRQVLTGNQKFQVFPSVRNAILFADSTLFKHSSQQTGVVNVGQSVFRVIGKRKDIRWIPVLCSL